MIIQDHRSTLIHLERLRSKYEGQWEYDRQHGHGVEHWVDGARYEGKCDARTIFESTSCLSLKKQELFGSHSPAMEQENHGHLCNFLHPFLESLQLDFVNFLGPRLGPWPGTLQGRSTAKVTSPGQMALPTMERTPTTFRCSSLTALTLKTRHTGRMLMFEIGTDDE